MNQKKLNISKNTRNILLCYGLILVSAIAIHAYFVYFKPYFSEACCDSLTQLAHFYPFLQNEYGQGNFTWSWEHGLGGDLFAGYLFYYSTSPFFWVSMLFDLSSLKATIEFKLYMSIFKLFLAMIFLYHLLRCLKRSNTSALIGSLIYGGSLYFMIYSLRYDFMADGMVWLSLVILGYERLIDKNKKSLFVFAVFLIVCSNFYLAFISSIYLFLYAILKYFLKEETYSFLGFFKHYVKTGFYYLIGFLLAAFAFLPAVYSYLHVDRFYSEIRIPLFFGEDFYQALFGNLFFLTERIGFVVVFPVLVLFLFLYGFLIRDKQTKIRFWFLLFIFLLALIPFTYSLFNGLSNMQYRWLYLFSFTFSVTSSFILDELLRKEVRLPRAMIGLSMFLLGLFCLYKGFGVWFDSDTSKHTADPGTNLIFLYKFGVCFIFLCGIIVSVILLMKNKWPREIVSASLIVVVFLNVSFLNMSAFGSLYGHPAALDKRLDTVFSWYGLAKDIQMFQDIKKNDPGFYRTTLINKEDYINEALVYHFNGFGIYNSLLSGNVHNFFKNEYNILQVNIPSQINKLDNRLLLGTALANKYYVIHRERAFQPYGYSLVKEVGDYQIWKNNFTLPIGFFYDAVVDEHTFARLNFSERDQLLLKAAVVKDGTDTGLPAFNPAQLKDKTFPVKKSNLKLINASLKGHLLTAKQEAKLIIQNFFYKQQGEVLVDMVIGRTDGGRYELNVNEKRFIYFGENSLYNYPKDEVVFRVGGVEQPKEIVIQLSPGQYKLEELKLTFNSFQTYRELVKEKQKQSLQNVKVTSGHVSGSIYAPKNGILFLSIPYSEGWRVKVDGVNTKSLEINSAFIGVPITKGTHKVVLEYRTPYLSLGLAISVTTLLILSGAFLYHFRYQRLKKK
ncbi:YfhO family protein [Paenactinomyces guangxiensis]|uniref:YfhO family protein n=1 Tax=Paenactinomyces guangxiensis TaxID=1490290 RepID=A0A7W1WND7_9BACL|nr:YfhO family protein [Paenactinomyces guangxiensis]MBA4493057.1 YfhO family protein [Paenactinomyces guangxiensis]MBH8590094.1 YfhO family protein [Paenactinomyces guangxiensis]